MTVVFISALNNTCYNNGVVQPVRYLKTHLCAVPFCAVETSENRPGPNNCEVRVVSPLTVPFIQAKLMRAPIVHDTPMPSCTRPYTRHEILAGGGYNTTVPPVPTLRYDILQRHIIIASHISVKKWEATAGLLHNARSRRHLSRQQAVVSLGTKLASTPSFGWSNKCEVNQGRDNWYMRTPPSWRYISRYVNPMSVGNVCAMSLVMAEDDAIRT